jgi:hypothetical protein
MEATLLSMAVVVWTGWGQATWPARDEARLVSRFGNDAAAELIPEIRRLEGDFYASDARFVTADLKTMGDAAAADFRRIHPEISEDAVTALAWFYTFNYK